MEGIKNEVDRRLNKAKDGVRRLTKELEDSDKVFNDGLKKAESQMKKQIGELEEARTNLEALEEFLNELIKM
jgi:hypothetical protein